MSLQFIAYRDKYAIEINHPMCNTHIVYAATYEYIY